MSKTCDVCGGPLGPRCARPITTPPGQFWVCENCLQTKSLDEIEDRLTARLYQRDEDEEYDEADTPVIVGGDR